MRALSITPTLYAIVALVYLSAGGATGWQFAIVHGLILVASLVLVVRSIMHIRRNESLSTDGEVTWVLLTLFVGFIALPVYWFVIARRRPRPGTPGAPVAPG